MAPTAPTEPSGCLRPAFLQREKEVAWQDQLIVEVRGRLKHFVTPAARILGPVSVLSFAYDFDIKGLKSLLLCGFRRFFKRSASPK